MKLINNFLDNLPQHNTSENNTTKEDSLKTKDSPPPTLFSGGVNLLSENTTGKELEISQQLFNTTSTLIQQPQNVELDKKGQTAYETKDAEAKKFI